MQIPRQSAYSVLNHCFPYRLYWTNTLFSDVEYIDDDGCLSWTELTDVLHIPSTGAGDGTAADTGVGTGAGM